MTKKIHLLLLPLFLLSFSISSADPTVDDEGGFVVDFPGPVTKQSAELDTAAGKIQEHRSNYKTDTLFYRVEYGDWPAADIAKHSLHQIYQDAIQAAVINMNGKLRSQLPYTLGSIEGIECVMDVPQFNVVFRFRFFLVNNRLFEVIYVGPPNTETSKSAEDFLNSFRLLK